MHQENLPPQLPKLEHTVGTETPILKQLLQKRISPPPQTGQQPQRVGALSNALRRGVVAMNTAMANASNAHAIFNDSLQSGFQTSRTTMSEAVQSTITTMYGANALKNNILGLPPPPKLAMLGPPLVPGHQWPLLPQGQGVGALANALCQEVAATNIAMADASNEQVIFNDSLQTGFLRARIAMDKANQSTITTMNCANALANALLGLPPPPPLAMPGPPPVTGPQWPLLPPLDSNRSELRSIHTTPSP